MSNHNACFSSHNRRGQNCRQPTRGAFQIPTGGNWQNVGQRRIQFKVTYFKYGSRRAYDVYYDGTVTPITWSCTCPDFEMNGRAENRTSCKHIQACVDKINNTSRGAQYEQFLIEHIS